MATRLCGLGGEGRALPVPAAVSEEHLPEVGFTHAKGEKKDRQEEGSNKRDDIHPPIQTILRGRFFSVLPIIIFHTLPTGWAVFVSAACYFVFRRACWNLDRVPSELGGPVENSSLN